MHRNWNDLIRPQAVEAEKLTDVYGKFVITPLEKGYGQTLGNSLRRVLLSSLHGAAVVAVRIQGVEHEFSTIQGVKEDVADIVLNIKTLNLRFLGESDATIRLKHKGAKILTGADIETSGDVDVLNPEAIICTLNDEGAMDMEMIVRHGRGYAPGEDVPAGEFPAGFIPVDAIYAPVRRVAYTVSHARVGQDTDYDRLLMEVWTNGAVRPDDALAYAAKILKEQLTTFINFEEMEELEEFREVPCTPKLNEHLFKTVDVLELSVRSANCLEQANIKYIGELVTKSEAEMMNTKNFGRKSLNEIKDILLEMGLSLGMKIEGFDPNILRTKTETSEEEGLSS